MQNYRIFVFLPVALSGLALSALLPVLTPLTRRLELADSQGGAIVSIGSVAMALCAAAWGRYSDRKGRKAAFLAGFAGLSLGYVLFIVVTLAGMSGVMSGMSLFFTLVFARILVGVALPAIPSSAQALIADNTDAQSRSGAMALLGLANGVGLVLGPALGGALAILGLIWPLIATCFLCALGFILIYLRMPQSAPRSDTQAVEKAQMSANLVVWLLISFLTFTTIITLQVCAGYFLQDRLSVHDTEAARILATVLTATGVALIAFQALQLKVLKWSELRLGLVAPFVMSCGLALLLGTASLVSYSVAYALMGIAAGMALTASAAGASNAVGPSHQGLVGGYIAAAQGASAIVAPIASTLIYERWPTLPFWLLICLAWVGFALVAGLALSRRNVAAAES